MTAPDPKQRTGAPPRVVDGVTFHCYRTGILRYSWISEDGRCAVQRNGGAETYWAAVNGSAVRGANPKKAKRFRSQSAAMLAAVFAMKRGGGV